MRISTILSLMIVFGLQTELHAQLESKSYKVKNSGALISEWDIKGDGKETEKVYVPGNAKFTIVSEMAVGDASYYIIRFLNWNAPKEETSSADFSPSADQKKEFHLFYTFNKNPETGEQRFFRITRKQLDDFASPIFRKFSSAYGVITMPVKLRQGGDFTKDLTLSGIGGLKWRPWSDDRFSVSLVSGIGISSVTLGSENSDVTDPVDKAAVSIPLGLVLEFDRLQFGLLTGWDRLSNKDQEGWIYQNKPWYTFGIGFSIFSDEKSSAPASGGNGKS